MRSRNIGDMPVKKVMTHRVITATEDMDVEAAAALMIKEGVARAAGYAGEKTGRDNHPRGHHPRDRITDIPGRSGDDSE